MGVDHTGKTCQSGQDEDIETYLNHESDIPVVVPEKVLRSITQGPLKKLIIEGQNNNGLFRLWKCLFHTFSLSSLPSSHRVAGCNAVSAFLDASLVSSNEELRQFALSEDTWTALYEIFLDRMEEGKPKPMKQVLNSLSTVLEKISSIKTPRLIYQGIIGAALPSIFLLETRSRLKASIVSLEWLIRKDAFPAVDFISELESWLWNNSGSWIPIFKEHCFNIDVPLDILAEEHSRATLGAEVLQVYAAQLLTLALLLNAQLQNVASVTGGLLSKLILKLNAASSVGGFKYTMLSTNRPFWIIPLKYVALLEIDTLESMTNHVFRPLFQNNHAEFREFIEALPLAQFLAGESPMTSDTEFELLVYILQMGKELGLVHEDKVYGTTASTATPLVLDSRSLRPFLVHSNANIRVSILALLVSAHSTCKPFSSNALMVLMQTLPFIHAETDARTRGQLLGHMRKLMVRVRGGSSAKDSAKLNDTTNGKTVDTHQFMDWYVRFLEAELYPCASYQTHILALRTLKIIIQSGVDSRIDFKNIANLGLDQKVWPFQVDIFQPSLLRVLGDLLLDPYDEVRATSLDLIHLFPRQYLVSLPDGSQEQSTMLHAPIVQFVSALSRVEDMAGRTGRADYADALARFYSLLFDLAERGGPPGSSAKWYQTKHSVVDSLLTKLENVTLSSSVPIHIALRNTPVHGYLASLTYIMGLPNFHSLISSDPIDPISPWRSFHDRTVAICNAIWAAVDIVLCVDSPEREHENDGDELMGPKDILSCSWRALRESSVLLNETLVNRTYSPPEGGLGYEDFRGVGNLAFTQLAELRHRGAFTAVSQTFASCCRRCTNSNDPNIASLPKSWYKEILNTIHNRSSKLTRRSAGLPALATGVALSAPKELFQDMIEDFQNISKIDPYLNADSNGLKLPQVHALNCLKELFTNAALGPITEPYIMPALHLSSEYLGSEIWAIRNCGLMLFRPLVNRMSRPISGSGGSLHKTATPEAKHRVDFRKFSGLIPLLSRLLESNSEERDRENEEQSKLGELSIITERIFPALELIGNKLPIRPSEEERILQDLVRRQFDSPVWGIRDHAARAYVSLINRKHIVTEVINVSKSLTSGASQNTVHSKSLCVKYLLRKLWDTPIGYHLSLFDSAMSAIEEAFGHIYPHVRSPFVLSTLVEILNDALQSSFACEKKEYALSRCEAMSSTYRFTETYDRITQTHRDTATFRSSSLLLNALALNFVILQLIGDASPEKLARFIEEIATADTDTGCAVLDQLHSGFGSHADLKYNRINFYLQIITSTSFGPVKTVAIASLAEELEALYDSISQLPEEIDVSKIRPALVAVLEVTDQISDRTMANAAVSLQGALLPFSIQSPGDLTSNPEVIANLYILAKNLTFAIRDETEFTTRYSAVISMKCLIRGLNMAKVKLDKSPVLLEILFVLYEMLQDDDEELREYAATACSLVLCQDKPVLKLPWAAGSELADSLPNIYGDSPRLFERSLYRFLGQNNQNRLFTPVSELLQEYLKTSTTLFAAEKQNLYLNEIKETGVWAECLARLSYGDGHLLLVQKFYSWVVDGLDALVETSQAKGTDGMIGWTSELDVFVTGLRVIHGAKVILLMPEYPDINTPEIRNKLQLLSDVGDKTLIHYGWTSLLQSCLDSDNHCKK